MSEKTVAPDVVGTHAHYYLSRKEEPRGCVVVRDDTGVGLYLFRDGSVLEVRRDEAPVALMGDPLQPKAWQTFATVQGQWQRWTYDQASEKWTGTVQVMVTSAVGTVGFRPIVESDWDAADAEICGGDDEHEAVCYVNVTAGPGGYYLSVGLDAGHFTADLAEDDGPYESYEAAVQAGRDTAIEWFIDNNLPYDGEEPLDEED